MHVKWDPSKASSDVRRGDSLLRVIIDSGHSPTEERFIILDMSMRARKLVVLHCLRGANGDVILIISAGRATERESAQYWRHIDAQ